MKKNLDSLPTSATPAESERTSALDEARTAHEALCEQVVNSEAELEAEKEKVTKLRKDIALMKTPVQLCR